MCRVTDPSWLLGFWFSILFAFHVPISVPAAGVEAAGTAGWETMQKLSYTAQNSKYL